MLHDRQQAQKNSHGLQVVRAVYKIIESRNEVRQASSLSVSLARASWAAPDRAARCLPPRLVPTRALRQEGGFPTRTQRLSPIPHGPAMNPGQREHRRRELLDRRISPPLKESRRWAWWAETPVLVDAKPGGSPYVHCESTGNKSGGSLREGRKFAAAPLRG